MPLTLLDDPGTFSPLGGPEITSLGQPDDDAFLVVDGVDTRTGEPALGSGPLTLLDDPGTFQPEKAVQLLDEPGSFDPVQYEEERVERRQQRGQTRYLRERGFLSQELEAINRLPQAEIELPETRKRRTQLTDRMATIGRMMPDAKYMEDPLGKALEIASDKESWEESILGHIPFGRGAAGAINYGLLYQSVKHIEEGSPTFEDYLRLAHYVNMSEAEKDKGILKKAKDIALMIPTYGTEIYLTSGAFGATKTAVQAVGVPLAEKAGVFLGKKLLTRWVERAVARKLGMAAIGAGRAAVAVGSRAIGVAAFTAANPTMIAENYARRMVNMPDFQYQRDDEGWLELLVDPSTPDGFGETMTKAFGDSYIELATELSGTKLLKVAGWLGRPFANALSKMPIPQRIAALKAAIAAAWTRRTGGTPAELYAKIRGGAKWDGVLGELLEERAGEVARGATGLEQWPDYLSKEFGKQLAAEGLAFGAVGATARGVQVAGGLAMPEAPAAAPMNPTAAAAAFAEAEPEKAAEYAAKENPTRKDREEAGLPKQKTNAKQRRKEAGWINSALDAQRRRQIGAGDAREAEETQAEAEEATEAPPFELRPEWQPWPRGEELPPYAEITYANGQWQARTPRWMQREGLPAPGEAVPDTTAPEAPTEERRQFNRGDRVAFKNPRGRRVEGIVKNVSEDGRKVTLYKGQVLDAGDVSFLGSRPAKESKAEIEADFAQRVANLAGEMGVDPAVLRGEVEFRHGQRVNDQQTIEAARGDAAKLTGLNAADVRRIENAGYDYATDPAKADSEKGLLKSSLRKLKRFDQWAVELARQHPGVIGHPEQNPEDLSVNLWALIRLGKAVPLDLRDPNVMREAADSILGAQVQEDEADFPFGANVDFMRKPEQQELFRTGEDERQAEFAAGTREQAPKGPKPTKPLVGQQGLFEERPLLQVPEWAEPYRAKLEEAANLKHAPEAIPFPEYRDLTKKQRLELIERGWRFGGDRQGKPVVGKSSWVGPEILHVKVAAKRRPPDVQTTMFQRAEPGRPDFEAQPAEFAGAMHPKVARWQVRPVPLPELVQIVKDFMGNVPGVKRLRKSLGYFVGPEGGGAARMVVDAMAAGDAKLLAKVVAHEIGHMIDWLPAATLARGNILGRIGSLRGYLKGWLEREPGGPSILTDEDRKRLKEEAKRLAMVVDEFEIEEEIEQRYGLTAEDVLAIWNSVDQSKLNPELLKYVKGLSAVEKLSVIKEAMRGVVAEDLQQFAHVIRRKTGRTKKVRVETPGTAEEVKATLEDLILDEILKRELLSRELIHAELVALSEWWTPYDKSKVTPRYIKYREASRELYAEALSVFLNSPGELAARAPEFYRGFTNWLGEKPAVLQKFLEMQELLNGTPQELGEARSRNLRDAWATADEKIRAAEAARQSARQGGIGLAMQWLSQAFITNWGPAKRAVTKLRKEGLDSQQARAVWYAMSELAYMDNPNHQMLTQLERQVSKPLNDNGIDRDDLGEYLFFLRVMNDRGEFANPQGHTPETAREGMRHLRHKLGDARYIALQAAGQRFHGIIYQSVERAVEEGVYPRAQAQALDENKGTYATFAVIDYLEDKIPAGLFKQVGTFKDIANPFDATIMKMVTLNRLIELNAAKNRMRDFMRTHMQAEITKGTIPYGRERPREKLKPGYSWLTILEDGKRTMYQMPTEMVLSFEREDIAFLKRATDLLSTVTYKIFHPLFVTFSPGFIAANPFRDLRRTWLNLGAIGGKWRREMKAELIRRGHTEAEANELSKKQRITLGQVLWAFWKAWPTAKRRAKGIEDATIDAMFSQKALSIPFVELDAELETAGQARKLMSKYGITSVQKERGQAMQALAWFANVLPELGTKQETATKVAAWNLITQRMEHARKLGLQPIDERERAFVVRQYAGTPNFKQKGLATPLTNSLMMYSNVRWQGMAADMEIAFGHGTWAGWWWRQIVGNIIPSTIARAARYGLYGAFIAWLLQPDDDDDELQKKAKRIGSYYYDAYDTIPVATVHNTKSAGAKTLFLTIPKDDIGVLLSRIWGNLLDIAMETGGVETMRGSPGRAATDIIGTVDEGIRPAWSPMIDLGGKWLAFTRGSNPRDRYLDMNVVPDKEWRAGGWSATKKMLAWTQMKFGVAGQVAEFVTGPVLGKPFESEPPTTLERLLRLPTGVNRLLRLSDRGLAEEEYLARELEDQEQARLALTVPDEGRWLLKQHYFYSIKRDESLSEDDSRLKGIYASWYYHTYVPLMTSMRATEDEERRNELRQQLGEVSRRVVEQANARP